MFNHKAFSAALLAGYSIFAMPVQAQQRPDTVPVIQTTTPQQNVQPQAAQPTQTATPAQPIAQPQSYIWFGNDQINEAANLVKGARYIEALAVLDKVIQRDVRLTEAHLLQGVSYLQLKDLTKAKQSFNTVLAINRGYMGAYIYMADIAIQEKSPEQAKLYLQAIRTVCQTTECAEYQYLKNALRTHGVSVSD
jgi:tetratricopeptide (TPR) repeat protein